MKEDKKSSNAGLTESQVAQHGLDFVDNSAGNAIGDVLNQRLKAGASEVRISTAYLKHAGFTSLAKGLENIPHVKLLLGTEPGAEHEQWKRKLDETTAEFTNFYRKRSIMRGKRHLRTSLNHLPFTLKNYQAVEQLAEYLRSDKIEVRLYEKNFLHAKAYIFSPLNEDDSETGQVYIGSSNLTAAGLGWNQELNLGCKDAKILNKSVDWFEQLWAEANAYDLARIYEDYLIVRSPHDIFLRILWEYYKDEIKKEIEPGADVSLTSFQKHGVLRAEKVIKKYRGAIIADEVGLGKTYIAGEIIERYRNRRQYSLVVCPASLCPTWDKYAHDANKHIETISFDRLANLVSGKHPGRSSVLSSGLKLALDDYQLIVVDEAHNFRNPNTPNRAATLRNLLGGKRKDLLLLTATPVNNSIMDLYYLLHYFIKDDSQFHAFEIQSLRNIFKEADKSEDLSPDTLFPIVDATTIKRTRSFIIEHYKGTTITDTDNKPISIKFPKPRPKTIEYSLDKQLSDLFGLLQKYLVPDDDGRNSKMLKFARYRTEEYRGAQEDLDVDQEDIADSMRYTGFLRVLLLKRFESSTEAFRETLNRMIDQHKEFIEAMKNGRVLTSHYFRRYFQPDGTAPNAKGLEDKESSVGIEHFDLHDALLNEVNKDLAKLQKLRGKVPPPEKDRADEKLKLLVRELVTIARDAEREGSSDIDRANKRKVLIFSEYADTVRWIYRHLDAAIRAAGSDLQDYESRLNYVVGSAGKADREHADKEFAAANFAPETAGGQGKKGAHDILVTTDVLAEGQNLQQARHIINFDMPWNPMRLVQRHGRIDRLKSKHDKVYLRTFFPIDRLDELLRLKHKIEQKISKASASVGVQSPIEHIQAMNADFAQNKDEIERLKNEDATLYEKRGTLRTIQSGEEYRQLLLNYEEYIQDEIVDMPWKAGSGMCRGKEQGIVFCAKVGKHITYLRFVRANSDWSLKKGSDENSVPVIEDSVGACLRIADCGAKERIELPEEAIEAAFEFWPVAQRHIHEHWTKRTDPKNLRVSVRKLNVDVADFIRRIRPKDIPTEDVDTAIDILSAPLEHNVEVELRAAFKAEDESRAEKSKKLVALLLDSGLEPPDKPVPNPPIDIDRVELLVWLAITAAD